MATRKNHKSKKSNKRFRKTRSKRQRGGVTKQKRKRNMNASLIMASSKGDTIIVNELLKKGANVNAKTKDGYTALIWASSMGHTKIVAMLLAAGADVNAKDNNGWTALQGASACDTEVDLPWYQVEHEMQYKTEIAEMLLEKGADVNARNDYGVTAFQIASRDECTETIKLLKRYIVAQTIPKLLERQQDRKNLAMVMSEIDVGNRGDGTMPYDLRHKIGQYLGGGKRKTRRKTRSKRQRGGVSESEDQRNAELIRLSSFNDPDVRIVIGDLLREGVSDRTKNTALLIASKEGHVEIVEMLLQ